MHIQSDEYDLAEMIRGVLAKSFKDPRAVEYRDDRIIEGVALKAVIDWFNETNNLVITQLDLSKEKRITIKNLARNLSEILATVAEREELFEKEKIGAARGTRK